MRILHSVFSPLTMLFRGRFRVVGLILSAYLGFNLLVRLGLLIFNGDGALAQPGTLMPILAIGTVFDLAAGVWWLPPFVLLVSLWPDRPQPPRVLPAALLLLTAATFLAWTFVGLSEFVFWNEFASRFNFIAVDYLIYTREVIGNIRESYDLGSMFAGIGAVTFAMLALAWRPIRHAAQPAGMPWSGRLLRLFLLLALPAVSFFLVDARYKEFTSQPQAEQLAGNGHYEFWHAFRYNEIDYGQFYRTEPMARVDQVLRAEFERLGPQRFVGGARLAVEREIVGQGPEHDLNVVLITVESLSAEFLAAFGNTQQLTPHLDRLAGQGMLFTQLYATGTRTVRGLEAVTLSIPPTPGNSIVKRPNNDRLYTLARIFHAATQIEVGGSG